MRKLLLFPTWVIYRAMRRHLPATHPWKNPIPLKDWCRGATEIHLEIAVTLWVCMLCIVVMLSVILIK